MNYDEFAFFNRQLAKMIQSGISLERGIQRLCATMKSSPIKEELTVLHGDLAGGMPIVQAMERRKLPDYYQAMVRAGVESDNLVGVLNLLADYYAKTGALWMRLKGLMVYPAIVLMLALALSFWTAYLGRQMIQLFGSPDMAPNSPAAAEKAIAFNQVFSKNAWAPFFAIGFISLGYGLFACVPSLRLRLEWAVPAFRDARLAQFASAMHLMLSGGCSLPSALALAGQLEKSSPVGREIAVWRSRCARGHGKWADIVAQSHSLPGLFRWLVDGPDEDLALGFKRAGEIYSTRAAFQADIMLYAAMPSVLLFLGILIMVQLYPFVSFIFGLFRLVNILR